jgi:hypothetical protein
MKSNELDETNVRHFLNVIADELCVIAANNNVPKRRPKRSEWNALSEIAKSSVRASEYLRQTEDALASSDAAPSATKALCLGFELSSLGVELNPAVRGTREGGRKAADETNRKRAKQNAHRDAQIKKFYWGLVQSGLAKTVAARRHSVAARTVHMS